MRYVTLLNKSVDPNEFRKGFGFAGWLVWLLGYARSWLEYCILMLLARSDGWGNRVDHLLRQEAFAAKKAATPVPAAALLRAGPEDKLPPSREGRYAKGSAILPPIPVVGMGLEALHAKQAKSREARYQRSPSTIVVYDVEE